MVVRTTATVTARVICSVARGYVDVATGGRVASVTLPWRWIARVGAMKMPVCIQSYYILLGF